MGEGIHTLCPRGYIQCYQCATSSIIRHDLTTERDQADAIPDVIPSRRPTNSPTQPTNLPTRFPTPYPSAKPTMVPTVSPTKYPTIPPTIPTMRPSPAPTVHPTPSPTNFPSTQRCQNNVWDGAGTLRGGAETDVDCGGPHCSPCGPYKECLVDRDCETNECINGADLTLPAVLRPEGRVCYDRVILRSPELLFLLMVRLCVLS